MNWEFVAKAALSFAIFSLLGGCMENFPNVKLPHSKRTFHEAVGWKAGDFFEDTDVVHLCQAIEANDIETIKQLLANGVDVNTIGEGGMTPLLWAFVDNKLERFVLLLEHGADPNIKITTRLGAPNAFAISDSVTTLVASSYFIGPYEAVLEHGGDVAIEGRYSQPLLHILIRAPISQQEKKRRIKLAMKHGADVNQKNSMGTVASTAVGYGQQWELVLWLLKLGVDPNYCRPVDDINLVGFIVAHEDRLTTDREEAYWALIEWLEKDGHDIDAAKKRRKELLQLQSPAARSRYIKGRIASQVRAGLRPNPSLGEEAYETWYALKRDAKRQPRSNLKQ